MSESIRSYRDLRVFQAGFEGAMEIFQRSKAFPPEERFALTDQVHLMFALRCQYIDQKTFDRLFELYETILGQLTTMIAGASKWTIRTRAPSPNRRVSASPRPRVSASPRQAPASSETREA